ncbi:MAG: IS5 family transposase [Candidatus Aminicenantales bacterium]
MYKSKGRKTIPLFPELFPFGGKLDERNRWLRVAELIPWDELEDEYRKHFSDVGRPAKDAQLIIGLLLLKHMTGLSDEGLVAEVLENPYMQAFCGFRSFVTEDVLDSSTLTKMRERLGLTFFKELERKTYKVLIDRKIIKAKGMLVDATVFPEDIKYPNDVGLLNDVQEWLVKQIKRIGRAVGRKNVRTYRRSARKEYLNFSKKKVKTKKAIAKAKKKMLQYVRRNIKQLKNLIQIVRVKRHKIQKKIRERLHVAEEIFRQQWEMYKRKVNRIANRIVSLHRPYVRPIKRGKQRQDTEFGGKGAVVHVDGFLFLDSFKHEAYDEAEVAVHHVAAYQERFGKLPPYLAADQKYGTQDNRDRLGPLGIRTSFKPRGRKAKDGPKRDAWFKTKQRERNRVEGHIGHGKEHNGLDRVRYAGVDGSEMWVRAGILAMNLKTALKRT